MEQREAIEKLERHSKLICHGCVHPSMVGWCDNHCKLPEAFNMAISALEKQDAIKACTPPSDDWEHYADRLHDIAYKSGYEQGKKDAEDEA